MRLKILSTVLILFLFGFGCLSGPLPEDLPKTTPQPTTPPPSLDTLVFLPQSDFDFSGPKTGFEELTPEINGLINVPYFSSVDVVSNDLSVLNSPQRLPLLAQILSKQTRIYFEPDQNTKTLIYYTVYKMNNSEAAEEILEIYKNTWNTRQLNVTGGEFWIWDGYIEEMSGLVSPMGPSTILYWDHQTNTSFLNDNVITVYPALATMENPLYSVHGEAASGQYFIMMDIKTDLQDIQNTSAEIFSEAAKIIFAEGIETPEESGEAINRTSLDNNVNDSIDESDVRADLRDLLESYLAGNISEEEYNTQFEEYNSRLKEN